MKKTITCTLTDCDTDVGAVVDDVYDTALKFGEAPTEAQVALIRQGVASSLNDPDSRALGIKITIRFKKFTIIIEF